MKAYLAYFAVLGIVALLIMIWVSGGQVYERSPGIGHQVSPTPTVIDQ